MKIRNAWREVQVADAFARNVLLLRLEEDYGDWVETYLTTAEVDRLIQHLIEVRGAERVQALLNKPWDGKERRDVECPDSPS